jgi:hypothetical protein
MKRNHRSSFRNDNAAHRRDGQERLGRGIRTAEGSRAVKRKFSVRVVMTLINLCLSFLCAR